MRHYLDSSVVLARLLEGNDVLSALEGENEVASSRLLWVEVSRVLHRGLQTGRLDVLLATEARHNFTRFTVGLSQIRLTEAVFLRAAGPYPLVVRTLDALHLASAELWLGGADPADMSIWALDRRLNLCAAHVGFSTPLLDTTA